MRDPTFRAFATALVLIAIWWFSPIPDHRTGRQVWLRHQWKACADVVVVGDSTVEFGLDPALVEDELHGYRVVNFAYTGISILDDTYLTAAENVLDPSTPHRTLVIALSPSDISTSTGNRYKAEAREIADGRRNGRTPGSDLEWRDELELHLRPRGLCMTLWGACGLGSERLVGYNGHMPVLREPHDGMFELPAVLEETSHEPVYDPTKIATLFARLPELRRRGVDVVVYVERRPPPLDEVYGRHGFDPDAYERRLRDAGADVIAFPPDLSTVDGVHLDSAGMSRWAAELGRALATRLPNHTASTMRCEWPLQSPAR